MGCSVKCRGRALALACVFIAWAGTANAGAWPQDSGHWQLITSGTFTDSRKGFDASGHAHGIADYRKFEFDAYLEYGITDDLTLVAQPRLRSVSIGAPAQAHHTGPGYTDLGARMRLWSDERSVLSGQVVARISTGGNAGDPALAGSTEHEADLRVLYGRSFMVGSRASFLDTQLAYRLRGGALDDQVRLDVTLGTRLRPDILIMAQSFNTFSTRLSRDIMNEDREHKVELSVVWDATPHLSLQLGAIATVAGRNTLRERGVVAAVWWRF